MVHRASYTTTTTRRTHARSSPTLPYEMVRSSGDGGFSPPAQPRGAVSYRSPSAAARFAVDRRRTGDHALNPCCPSTCPTIPSAPSHGLPWSWVEPLPGYIGPAVAASGYSGITNSDGFPGSACYADETNESIMLGGSIGNHDGSMGEKSAVKVSSHISASTTTHAKSSKNNALQGNTSNVHKVAVTQESLCSETPSNRELIKSIYNLSEILLSTCNGDYELDESDQELIQSARQNLNSASPKRSKNPSTVENNSDIIRDAQVLAYRNLWIEAEASVCKFKYELQLARMKLGLKCQCQQTGADPTSPSDDKPSCLPKSKSSICTGALDDPSKQQNVMKEIIIRSTTLLHEEDDTDDAQYPGVNNNIANKIEAGVFDQQKVLKCRGDSMYSFCEGNDKQQQETSRNDNKTDSVDNTFAVSVVTKSVDDSNGINSVVEKIIKEQVESSKTDIDDVDAPVFTAIRDILMGHYTISSDMDFDQVLLEASEKISDVKIRSLNEDRTNQCQAASKERCQLEDGVMARSQVLKRRKNNTNSIEKTELLDDDECTTQYDEADSKTAVQHLDMLLEEPRGLPVSLKPASLGLDDDLDLDFYEIPRWWRWWKEWQHKHVQKEDCFFPGNARK